MDALAALGRMSVSLVAVLGLVWLVTRWLRRSRGAAGGGVSVLSRTPIGAKAGVAVVRVGERALVVGVTEHQVSLLTEVPLEEVAPERATTPTTIEIPAQPAASFDEALAAEAGAARPGAAPQLVGTEAPAGRAPLLAGSALSPATWTQALHVIRERTTRR